MKKEKDRKEPKPKGMWSPLSLAGFPKLYPSRHQEDLSVVGGNAGWGQMGLQVGEPLE